MPTPRDSITSPSRVASILTAELSVDPILRPREADRTFFDGVLNACSARQAALGHRSRAACRSPRSASRTRRRPPQATSGSRPRLPAPGDRPRQRGPASDTFTAPRKSGSVSRIEAMLDTQSAAFVALPSAVMLVSCAANPIVNEDESRREPHRSAHRPRSPATHDREPGSRFTPHLSRLPT